MSRTLNTSILLVSLLATPMVVAQEDVPPPMDSAAASEMPAYEQGPTATLPPTAEGLFKQTGVIKTIQRKNFFKAERMEFSIYAGGVTNDPFLRRWLGGASLTYHVNEIFSLEAAGSFSPDLGEADNRQLTDELQTNYAASPIISKIRGQGSLDVIMSPLYGKFSFLRTNIVNFDIYLAAGAGMTFTQDQSIYTCDGTLRDPENAPPGSEVVTPLEVGAFCESHFTTNYGFGFRGAFNEWMAIRFDGRNYMYIEYNVNGAEESLEMKSNFVAQLGLSFFFPRRPGVSISSAAVE